MWTILSENTNKYVHTKLRQAKDNGHKILLNCWVRVMTRILLHDWYFENDFWTCSGQNNGILRMLSLLQYCSRELFLRIPITIRWATNTLILSGIVSSQLFSYAEGFWSWPSLSNSIGSLCLLSFACLSFVWTYLLVFLLSIVHILSSKNSSKIAPGVNSFKSM